MSVSVNRQYLWRPPRLFRQRSEKEIIGARKRPLPLRWMLILKSGIALTIIIWLVAVVWVAPVG